MAQPSQSIEHRESMVWPAPSDEGYLLLSALQSSSGIVIGRRAIGKRAQADQCTDEDQLSFHRDFS